MEDKKKENPWKQDNWEQMINSQTEFWMYKEGTKSSVSVRVYIKKGWGGIGRKDNVKMTPRGINGKISNFMASDSSSRSFSV